ncbi:hypothetical protein Hanom_Chr01g00080991 [Helianthus anomalus]
MPSFFFSSSNCRPSNIPSKFSCPFHSKLLGDDIMFFSFFYLPNFFFSFLSFFFLATQNELLVQPIFTNYNSHKPFYLMSPTHGLSLI